MGKFPGWRTMTASQRYNARMSAMFEESWELKARAAGWSKEHPTIPNPEGYIMHPDRYHPAGNVVTYESWRECCVGENIF